MLDSKAIYKDKLLKTIGIQYKIVSESINFDENNKYAFIDLGDYWAKRIENESFTLTSLKSIANDILKYWRESISIETELFWQELIKNNIEFVRRDELKFALDKGRFRRVDIGIGARKDWMDLKNTLTIIERFSSSEIEKIELIIINDEKRRLEILQKCFIKKEIPQSQYLKFGECMAYFSNCKLFDKYFDKNEVIELYEIWKNFKSK